MAFGWGSSHVWLHTTLADPWPHSMHLEVCWDGLWTLLFGLSQLWLFLFTHWTPSKTSICEVLYDKSLSKTFPSSRSSSLSSSPPEYRSKIACGPSPMRNLSRSTWARVTALRGHALPLSLNVLLLYGDMEQLAKLCISICALLAWSDCSSEYMIRNIQNASKYGEFFWMHLKMNIFK
jgi:hypothetical protein